MLEYELVDANGDIQKVKVEPATRSAVATCKDNRKKNNKTLCLAYEPRGFSCDQLSVVFLKRIQVKWPPPKI